jgi:acetyl-CoA acetyltransferase
MRVSLERVVTLLPYARVAAGRIGSIMAAYAWHVNGGSIAIGHPLGATGARLVLTVAHELRRSGGKYALATQCIGAGMGISTIIESLDNN